MRTTIRLNDELLREAKRLAANSGTTLTAIIEDSLRERLRRGKSGDRVRETVRLVTAGRGGVRPGIDLDDSASLLDALDGVD